MRLGRGDVLRAAQLLSLLLSEDEEDKRERAGSLSFYLFSEILQLGKLHNIRCTGKLQYGIYIPTSIFSAVSCSSLSGPGGQRQWSPTHDPPFVPQ